MTTVVRTSTRTVVAPAPPSATVVRPGGGGSPGAKGDPGGNVMAIGLFTTASGLTIPGGTDLVQTSGHHTKGLGVAQYVEDSALDDAWIAAHPKAGFKSANGRFFRTLAAFGLWVSVFATGAADATGVARQSSEVVSDNIVALEGMRDYVFWCAANRNAVYGMDFQAQGLGASRSFIINTNNPGEASWNSLVFPIMPGRVVAMDYMDNVIEVWGKNYQVFGCWQPWGGTDAQLNTSDYSTRFARNLMFVSDIGSNMGDIEGQGARRFGLQWDKVTDLSDNNSIGCKFGKVSFVQCGVREFDAVTFAGTYSDGTWEDAPANNGSGLQRHLLTLHLPVGCDPRDIEVYDPYDFDGFPANISEVVSVDVLARTAVVRLNRWLPNQSSGVFLSLHGGGVSMWGGNTANVEFESLICAQGGTAIQLSCQYGPKISTFLANSMLLGVQLGGAGESMEGITIEGHIESVKYAVLDWGSCSNCWLGFRSNLQGDNRGKMNLCQRPTPSYILGGVWKFGGYGSLRGVTIEFNGGPISTPYDIVGRFGAYGGAIFGNAPEYHNYGPQLGCDHFTFVLTAEKSMAERGLARSAEFIIIGNGPQGGPLGDIDFQITSSQGPTAFTASIAGNVMTVSALASGLLTPRMAVVGSGVAAGTEIVRQTSGSGGPGTYIVNIPQTVASEAMTSPAVTVEGGATHTIPPGTGAIAGYVIYDSPDTGDAGDWKVVSWRMNATADLIGSGGGSSSASIISALPLDAVDLGFDAWFDPSRDASAYQDTGTTTLSGRNDPVADLRDVTGNGHHALQSDTAKRLTLRKLGSLVYVEANGVDQWLKIASLSRSQPCTLAAAVLCDNDAAAIGSIFYGAQALQAGDAADWRIYANNVIRGGARETRPQALIGRMNGVSSEFFLGGELIFTGDAGNAALSGALYLLVAPTETSQFFKGAFFCGGIGPALTDAQLLGLNASMMATML